MKVAGWSVVACLLTAGWLSAFAAAGEEQELQFLHALQDKGYGDVAADYLKMLQQRPDTPAALRDVFDLEMYRSLVAWAKDAYNQEEFEKLMEGAQQHLTKFIKEQPKHPEAEKAMSYWGNFSTDRALKYLRAAQTAAEKAQKDKFLADARAALEEARPRFKDSAKLFQARLAKLPPPPKTGKAPLLKPTQRELAEREALEKLTRECLNARFQAALVDYYVSQTYSDPKDEKRIAALKTAAKGLDGIYQEDRLGLIGLIAHMWHGKTLQEIGDLRTALEVYDEVLANASPSGDAAKEKDPMMDGLYAQVENFRLQILYQQEKTRAEYFEEAPQWLEAYQTWSYTDGYQAISIDLAKAYLAEAKKLAAEVEKMSVAKDKEKERDKKQKEQSALTGEAVKLLRAMAKVRSQYQHEAIVKLREVGSQAGKIGETSVPVEAGTPAEGIALGDAASQDGKWDEALGHYQRAIEMLEKRARIPREKAEATQSIARVRDGMAATLCMKAREQLAKGKANDCIETTKRVLREFKECLAAPQASAMAGKAALHLYMTSEKKEDKDAALEQLAKIANFTAETWPGKPEADEARLTIAQSLLVQGKLDEALKMLDNVNPQSDCYGEALQLSGRTSWYRYATEKTKPEAARKKEAMAAERETAVKKITESVGVQRKKLEPARPLPRLYIETQLLLAEMALEGREFQQAASLLQPLVDAVKTDKDTEIDKVTLRMFVAAVRAYVELKDLEKAAGAGLVLAESGPDVPLVNAVLVEFTKELNEQRKEADAALTKAIAESNQQAAEAAKAKVTFSREMLGKLVVKLLPREKLSLPAMVLVADTCMVADRDQEAREQYQRILKMAADNPDFAKTAEKALIRVRSQLVGLLKKEGKYEEAMTQVEALLKTNARALEPLMEKGRILQARAVKDPQYFPKAKAHWIRLRDMLQPKKQPAEYYEVTYNLASCMYAEATKMTDKAAAKELARQAEGLLKSAMVLAPKLDGPDTVEKYKALIGKLAVLQGRSPAVEKPAAKKPAAAKPAAK